MAGLGHKTWTRERLTSADLQGYLQDQVVTVWASRSARTAGLPAPTAGMVSYLDDERLVEQYSGGAWRTPGPLGVVHYATQTTAGSSSSSTVARVTGSINGTCTLYPGRLYRGRVKSQVFGNTAGDVGNAYLLIAVGASTPVSSDPQVAAINFYSLSATAGAVTNPLFEDLFTVTNLNTFAPTVWLRRLSGTGQVSIGPQFHGKWSVEIVDEGSVALRGERQATSLGTPLSIAS